MGESDEDEAKTKLVLVPRGLRRVERGMEETTGETPTAIADPSSPFDSRFESEPLPEPIEREESSPTFARPLSRPIGVGDVIAEKYRLVRQLGSGGMGRIFAADHLLLGTKVALKFMHPHLAHNPSQVGRFAREARAAALLKSEHVARIMDVDQLPGGELYIVMEYLEGISLEALVQTRRGLPAHEAVGYVMQACDAIAEAHDHAILHRDIKPANLFLTKGSSNDPVIKVLDFGLAKIAAAESLTVANSAVGTPYYMAPEQITASRPVDARSDIWAIGASLYELLTAQLAFPGKTAPVVFDRILRGKPLPLSSLRPDVPSAVISVVERCLEHDPALRFQTVRELTRALQDSLNKVGAGSFEPITKRIDVAPVSVRPPSVGPAALPMPPPSRETLPMAPPSGQRLPQGQRGVATVPPSFRMQPPPSTARAHAPRATSSSSTAAVVMGLVSIAMVAIAIALVLMKRGERPTARPAAPIPVPVTSAAAAPGPRRGN